MSEVQFLEIASIPEPLHEVALGIRRVLAKMCKIDSSEVRPEVDFIVLTRAMRSGPLGVIENWDFMTFVLTLESDLRCKIFLRSSDLHDLFREGMTVGEFVRETAARVLEAK